MGVGTLVIVGPCASGVANQLYVYNNASPVAVKSELGAGILTEYVIACLNLPGHSRIIAVPGTAAAGVNSAVVDTVPGGGTGTVTLTGTPLDYYQGKIVITKSGDIGTGKFKYSLDGGLSYSDEILTAATYLIPESGITIAMAVGTGTDFVVGDYYTFTTQGPQISTANQTIALAAIRASNYVYSDIFIASGGDGGALSDSDATRASGLNTELTNLETAAAAFDTANKSCGIWYEGAEPNAYSDMATYRAAYASALASRVDNRIAVCMGPVQYAPIASKWALRRPAPGISVCQKLAVMSSLKREPQQLCYASDIGYVGDAREGALPSIIQLYHDELANSAFDDARIITTCNRNGIAFLTQGLQLAAVGSDYRYSARYRLMTELKKFCQVIVDGYVNATIPVDSATGYPDENWATGKDTAHRNAIMQTYGGGDGVIVNATVIIRRNVNVLSTNDFYIDFSITPYALAKNVVGTIGFSLTPTVTPSR
jgi:hypothetical protein